jgi:hypothetical protein
MECSSSLLRRSEQRRGLVMTMVSVRPGILSDMGHHSTFSPMLCGIILIQQLFLMMFAYC